MWKFGGAVGVATLIMLVCGLPAAATTFGPEPMLFSTSAAIGAGGPGEIFTPAGPFPDVVNAPGAGGAPVIAINQDLPGGPPSNGLYVPGAGVNVDAFSRGEDLADTFTPGGHGIAPGQQNGFLFSVDSSAVGAAGSGVAGESTGAGAAADVFASLIKVTAPGTVTNSKPTLNELVYDADGSFGLPAIGLTEGVDDLDALDVIFGAHPKAQDLSGLKYFSLDAASAVGLGVSGSDILQSPLAPGPTFGIFALGTDLGLNINDDIDALILAENGSTFYEPAATLFDWTDAAEDMMLFSLAPGSPTIGSIDSFGKTIGPGDILVSLDPDGAGGSPGVVSVFVSASDLGLLASDNLNALDVVPEPSTYVLAAIGLFALGWTGWRRSRRCGND